MLQNVGGGEDREYLEKTMPEGARRTIGQTGRVKGERCGEFLAQ